VPRAFRHFVYSLALSGLLVSSSFRADAAQSLRSETPWPAGDVSERLPEYQWKCATTGRYRVQIRRGTGDLELTSDWHDVRPFNGLCRLSTYFMDQLRLRAGTLPLLVDFTWSFQFRDDSQPWSSPTHFRLVPISVANFDGQKSEWNSYGPGWSISSGALHNNRGTGVTPAYYLLPLNGSAASGSNSKEIGARVGVDCGSAADCRVGIVLSASVNDACKKGDQNGCDAGPPPRNSLRFWLTNGGRTIIDYVDSSGQETVYADREHSSFRSLDNAYLRVMMRDSMYRIYLNGELLACGTVNVPSHPLLPSNTYAALSWKSTAGLDGGTGLVVRDLVAMESPNFRTPMSWNGDCWVPVPPPFEGWK
jgi:hypothetical protein